MIAYILCAVLFFATTAFSLAARGWMKRKFMPYRSVQAAEGLTGGTLARQLLDAAGLPDVRVAPAPGHSADFYDSDFYDPKDRTLRLTAETMDGANVAALGAAAHEVGHAMQAADGSRKFYLRSDCMRPVDIGAQAAWIIMQISFFADFKLPLILGEALYMAMLVFALIALPMERDASRRAMRLLEDGGCLTANFRLEDAKRVLSARSFVGIATVLTAHFRLFGFGLDKISKERNTQLEHE